MEMRAQFVCMLPVDLIQDLRALSAATGCTQAQYVRQAVRRELIRQGVRQPDPDDADVVPVTAPAARPDRG